MRVSVLMPVYNKAPFVKEAIDSVLNGSFQDFEIVCVDDKSTDESVAVVRSIADPRVRVIELAENLGPAGAANRCLDEARGDYLVRLDADDLAVPDRLSKQVAYMDAHPEVVASGGHLQLFGARDRLWKFPIDHEDCMANLLFGVPVSQGASIMRRSVVEQHHLRYDPSWPRVGEDWLFWLRVSRVGRFGNLDEAMTLYRRGEQNISHGRDKSKDFADLTRRVFAYFELPLSDEQLDLHLLAGKIFRHRPDADQVKALRAWLNELLRMNEERKLFPIASFSKRLEALWDELFHFLADRSTGAALAHLKLSGRWPMDRVAYLGKQQVKAILRRH
ncbi:MAG: glycosyltransferase family 2 protein [Flavobacteriales bacterium]|nr:glycosyltransferase family 2 protein [Flavobacteriales bacterium]